uniref:Uncharacterized protein n=1 Tax=Romanomermis culicivorax TaxID=13658 RepID=A0A915L1Z4_ROMCU
MPAVEQKGIEPPSPMKVDDDFTIDKLVIDENVAETPDSKMADSKETDFKPAICNDAGALAAPQLPWPQTAANTETDQNIEGTNSTDSFVNLDELLAPATTQANPRTIAVA